MSRQTQHRRSVRKRERILWRGRPSQWGNLGAVLSGILLCWIIVPFFKMIWVLLETRATRYTVTTQRLLTRHGVLSVKEDQIELYRVKDFAVERPLLLRLAGLGNLVLTTSDRTHPVFRIHAVRDPGRLANGLRRATEQMRRARGVREFD